MAAPVRTLLCASPGQLVYRIVGDSEAGVVTIANSVLVADAANGPLKDLLNDALPTANQANARAKLLGEGKSSAGVAGKWESHAEVQLNLRDTEANVPGVDADLDAVTATKAEYNVDVPAVACTIVMYINYRHSILG